MQVQLAYGKKGLRLNFPDEWNLSIIDPQDEPELTDPDAALSAALRSPIGCQPLYQWVKPQDRVGIVFSDITRPAPTSTMVRAILKELQHIPDQNILLFNALGTHRQNTRNELYEMVGEDIVHRFRLIQNDAENEETQVWVGKSAFHHDIWLNRELVACDKKILTGFIEPHFFAGFSGGGKAVMPGMAGLRTILLNHGAEMIAHPRAAWGITEGNPIWEEIQQAAHLSGEVFLLNVTLNKQKQVTGIYAGALDRAHPIGCQAVRRASMVKVDKPFDIVITTNSGYPLDLNLYQSVKGISAAAQITRPGGTILIAAECRDGVPAHGEYSHLLEMAETPKDLLGLIHSPGFLKRDQWQVQIQAQIQLRADIHVYSEGLSDEQIWRAKMKPCRDIMEAINHLLEKYGRDARIGLLPQGPLTIPFLTTE